MRIHPTAIVSTEARVSDTAEIGAYAVLEGHVRVGEGCRIQPHAQLVGEVELGNGCSIGRGAVIGEYPQDLSFDTSISSGVVIGENTVIREHVTIHRGSAEGSVTRVGARNFLMVGCHLAHDVRVGDDTVLANAVLIAGHVEVGSRVFFGGGTVVHQFVRIGDYAMTQGNSAISKDIPPYTLTGGLNTLFGLNVVGLRRAGISRDARVGLKSAYKQVFHSGRNMSQALSGFDEDTEGEVGGFINFLREKSKKGICGSELGKRPDF